MSGTAAGEALAALEFNWGSAYKFGAGEGEWWAARRDGAGGKITAGNPDDLTVKVRDDYLLKHVPREFAPAEGT
jgi:hypothetical protein